MDDFSYDCTIVKVRAALLLALDAVSAQAHVTEPEHEQPNAAHPAPAIITSQHHFNARSDWLRVGGDDFVPASPALFLTSAYATRYVPGVSRSVYIAHCTGLGALAKSVDRTAFKLSTCGPDLAPDRMWQGSDDVHGGAYVKDGKFIVDAARWTNWQLAFPRLAVGPSPGGPVTIGARSIDVILPATMTPEEFDRCFDAMTRRAALDVWAESAAGYAHCVSRGVDPQTLQRWTVYPRRPGLCPTASHELCVFRQRKDGDRLVEIIERIVLKHLGLVA